MKKIFWAIIKVLVGLYVLLCILLFFFQERLIFFPEKLNPDYQFIFDQKFEEIRIRTSDNIFLSGVLFKADSSKGVIFYLHGNGGSVRTWGHVAQTYTELHYDVFMPDYRGYGKSQGSICSETQFYEDLQSAYDELKKKYSEDKITVLGYSIGTGPAAKIASVNNPKMLILQAPYYSLVDMMIHNYKIVPTFILKYKFETNKFIRDCKMPIVDFHGNRDEVVYYESSLQLRNNFKTSDTLITLDGQGHMGITDNPQYKTEIKRILGGK